jgi:hypothetical protein
MRGCRQGFARLHVMVALASVVFLAAACGTPSLSGTAPASPSVSVSAAPSTYSSFAYGPVAQVVGYGTGTDPVSAQAAAEFACRQQGGGVDCQGICWWTHGYGSFAKNDTGAYWCSRAQTIQLADQRALTQCGKNCRIVYHTGIGGSGSPMIGDNLNPIRGNDMTRRVAPGTGNHTGPDYWAADFVSDSSEVYPVRPGRIVFSGYSCDTPSRQPPCYGNTVVVDHGGGLYSIYTHLAASGMAPLNQRVTAQIRIGTVSNSGCTPDICGNRPDLHFALHSGPPNLGANALSGANTPVRTPWSGRSRGIERGPTSTVPPPPTPG